MERVAIACAFEFLQLDFQALTLPSGGSAFALTITLKITQLLDTLSQIASPGVTRWSEPVLETRGISESKSADTKQNKSAEERSDNRTRNGPNVDFVLADERPVAQRELTKHRQ